MSAMDVDDTDATPQGNLANKPRTTIKWMQIVEVGGQAAPVLVHVRVPDFSLRSSCRNFARFPSIALASRCTTRVPA